MIKHLNSDNFEHTISNESGLFLIKFFSPTCWPCQSMTPVFETLAHNNHDLNVYHVDTMESPDIAERFGVRAVPYVTYCEGREVIYSFTGVTPLRDLQFVIDNIDDSHFRTYGEFQIEKPPKTYWFELSILLVVSFLLLLFLVL